MFTVEIKINGSLVTHIYGYNAKTLPGPDTCLYEIDVYNVEQRKIRKIDVVHNRINGINVLVEKILAVANKKQKD